MISAHLYDFLFGLGLMWLASGLVIRGIERFARNTRVSTFASSFLILGVLTSLTEISVGFNAVLEKKPSIFVGNLIGGSFVILLLIIPVLAIFSGGITLRHRLDQKRLLFFLVLIAAPMFMTLDGRVSIADAVLLVIFYLVFFYFFQDDQGILDRLSHRDKGSNKSIMADIVGVVIGAIIIYYAGKILVDKTIILSQVLAVPPLLLSLLLLSLGTNLPELTIAFRSLKRHHSEIAFGDYIGSAATNSALFAVLTFIHGSFNLETRGFTPVFMIMVIGFSLFFIFARVKDRISPAEGLVLILIYLLFLLFQTTEILSLSPTL